MKKLTTTALLCFLVWTGEAVRPTGKKIDGGIQQVQGESL